MTNDNLIPRGYTGKNLRWAEFHCLSNSNFVCIFSYFLFSDKFRDFNKLSSKKEKKEAISEAYSFSALMFSKICKMK